MSVNHTENNSLTYPSRCPNNQGHFSFIHRAMLNPRVCAIFENMLQLSSRLGLDVVAEGVEDIDDWNFLCAAHYELLVQGYFIAHPMPAADVFDWIQNWHSCSHDKFAIKGRLGQ
ncbi:EAL domain-containing protein [Nitrosomonas aestuarii]|uniref:EAL domain-containing protein n=1 Tax=Nitrosomonas aestuarii TaxID=52441 RepID=UPI000D3229C5|nr:EAL domain-containing protein [Nitrosomonas aestuarii]PTN09663.1 EAL domain-containing protein [Nitrosomonas aestuarii]